MAGALVLIDEENASNSSSVSLTGISSTYDVYVCYLRGVVPTADANFLMRTTTGGSADSDSEYDKASEIFKANTSFGTTTDTNEAQWRINNTVGTDTNEETNHEIFLFNFNNSNEFSYYTNNSVKLNASGVAEGHFGGGSHTVKEINDGVNFFFASGNIESGNFKMYAFRK